MDSLSCVYLHLMSWFSIRIRGAFVEKKQYDSYLHHETREHFLLLSGSLVNTEFWFSATHRVLGDLTVQSAFAPG